MQQIHSNEDRRWMDRALRLAARGEGSTRPNPPVGALVVRGRRRVGAGYHARCGEVHAEVAALRQAGAQARGATLYVTLEPCSSTGRTPPCADAVIAAGVSRVVVAVKDPNPLHSGRGLRKLSAAGVEVKCGVCETEADRLITPFRKWIISGKPYLTLKLGMTADGRIADAEGRSRWITCTASRAAVHAMRRRCDAVLVGRGTAEHDNPSLLAPGDSEDRLWRVVVDSTGRLPPELKVFSDDHRRQTILATTARCSAARRDRFRKKGVTVWSLPARAGRVSLKALCGRLGKMGLLHILCEGGGELAGGLVDADLVDEYIFFIAPKLLGGSSRGALEGKGWMLGREPRLRFTECGRVGDDIMVKAEPCSRES